MTNITDLVEGCRTYRAESWAILFERLATEEALIFRRVYTLPAASFLATLHIQNHTTSAAGIEKWGFSELEHRLSALPGNSALRIEDFDSKAFAVRCVLDSDSDSATLLGCTIVQKRQNARQTPPAWDGSLDALERFNNPPKE